MYRPLETAADLCDGLGRRGEADVRYVDHVDAVRDRHHLVVERTVGRAHHQRLTKTRVLQPPASTLCLSVCASHTPRAGSGVSSVCLPVRPRSERKST